MVTLLFVDRGKFGLANSQAISRVNHQEMVKVDV
jgi:hypothetical protein